MDFKNDGKKNWNKRSDITKEKKLRLRSFCFFVCIFPFPQKKLSFTNLVRIWKIQYFFLRDDDTHKHKHTLKILNLVNVFFQVNRDFTPWLHRVRMNDRFSFFFTEKQLSNKNPFPRKKPKLKSCLFS